MRREGPLSDFFKIHSMYTCSLNMRFYFHNSRHENKEIIEDRKFKKKKTVKSSLLTTTVLHFESYEPGPHAQKLLF
jgi:hypothetical protein